jgi:hypothetical protein
MNLVIKSTDIFDPNTYWKVKEKLDQNPKRINQDVIYRVTLKFDRNALVDERMMAFSIPESKSQQYPNNDVSDHIYYLLNLQLKRASRACKNAGIQSHHFSINGDDLADSKSLVIILEKETEKLIYQGREKNKRVVDGYFIVPDLPGIQQEFVEKMAQQLASDIKNGKINLDEFRKKD